jgi:putative flippase GtrA
MISKILKNKKQLITYFIVGVITNILNYLTYLLILVFLSNVYIASLMGFSSGLISNFFLNKKHTFNSKTSFNRKFFSYLLVQAFVLIVQLFSLKIFIFLIIEELAQLPAILVSGVLNYILLKNYIFNK